MPGPDVTPPAKPSELHLRAVRERIVARSKARSAVAPGVFFRSFQYDSAQTPGWTLKRARTVLTGVPGIFRLTQLTLAAAEAPACTVKLEVYETRSPEAARELLVDLLTGFQSLPELVELEDGIGETAVVFPRDTARLLARGNLVVLIANSGSQLRGVSGIARALDQFLLEAPVAGANAAAAALTAPTAGVMTRFATDAGPLRQTSDGAVVTEEGAEVPPESAFDVRNQRWHRFLRPRPKEPPQPGKRPRKKS